MGERALSPMHRPRAGFAMRSRCRARMQGMSEPTPHAPRAPLISPKWLQLVPPKLLKPLLVAFGGGLLLFLLVWLDQRNDNDFYKAGQPVSGAPGEVDGNLPAPIPADVAGGNGNASGLGLPRANAPADGGQPRIVDEPPVAPPPPAAPPSAPAPPKVADIQTPIPISQLAPRYPREALSRDIGGTVRVRATVAPDGRVERMEVAESSGNRYLDRAAMEAVRRWTFKPATRNGQPVSADVVVPLDFKPGR